MNLPKIGINLGGYSYYSTNLPFEDVAHMDGQWHSGRIKWEPGGDTRIIPVTEQGYPTSLEPNQLAMALIFMGNGGVYPLGWYMLKWEGDGDVRLFGQGVVKKSPNVYEVTLGGTSFQLQITRTNPDNPVRGIQLLLPTGFGRNGFNATWLNNTSKYGVLRFMDWGGTNSSKVSKWSQRTRPTDAFGIPYEEMIRLANELHEDMWLCVPHLADDDYVRSLGDLVDTQLDRDLRCWLEYSNEVWNGGFAQCRYAVEVLQPKYGVANSLIAYGRRAGEVFGLFTSAMRKPRVVRVLSGQAANWGTLTNAIIGCGSGNFDVLAIAPYFTCDIDWLYAQHKAGTVNLDEVFVKINEHIDTYVASATKNCTKIAVSNNVPLVAYEGGQHVVAKPGTQHNDVGFVNLIKTINRDPRMGEAYKRCLDVWDANGGWTMVLFNDIFAANKWGCWGLQESYLDAEASKFKAVQGRL